MGFKGTIVLVKKVRFRLAQKALHLQVQNIWTLKAQSKWSSALKPIAQQIFYSQSNCRKEAPFLSASRKRPCRFFYWKKKLYILESWHLYKPPHIVRDNVVFDHPFRQVVPLPFLATVNWDSEFCILVFTLFQILSYFLRHYKWNNIIIVNSLSYLDYSLSRTNVSVSPFMDTLGYFPFSISNFFLCRSFFLVPCEVEIEREIILQTI